MKLMSWSLFFMLVGCNFQPPSLSSSSRSDEFFIRNIQVSCEDELTICADQSADQSRTISYYTTESCQNISDSTPVIALGNSQLLCNDSSCSSQINEFFDEEVPVSSLPEGSYSLVSFVDVNDNFLPDSDEPYLCAHNVEISALKNNTTLSVLLTQTRSESLF